VIADSAGNLYIADEGNNRIRKVSNGIITTVAGNATSGYSGDNGAATSAELYEPFAVAVDSFNNLYISDSGNSVVRKVSNGVIATVAGGGSIGDGGPAAGALLSVPKGVGVDSAGNLYIADQNANRVRKVSNGVITTVAGNGTPGFAGDNGPAASAELYGPSGVAVDSAGSLYIADFDNNRIRKVSNGIISTVAGNGESGFSGDNGPATSAQLNYPIGVAVDSAGNLYIADTNNNRIRRVSNGEITTVAGNGTPGLNGDNGPATIAELYNPFGVAVDAARNIYIADTSNQRIRKVSNGVISTVAANDFSQPSGSQLESPVAIAVDSSGSLYVADSVGESIRKIVNGVVATIAGNFTPSFSGDNGLASAAQLFGPTGVAVDYSGKVYIADSNNQRVRLLTPAPSASSCTDSVSPSVLEFPPSGANLTISIQTASYCFWTVSNLPVWISDSGSSSGAGSATVTLAAAPNNTGSPLFATISITGAPISITQAANPIIYASGVVNAASAIAGAPLAPGSIATAYGSFQLTSAFSASVSPLPTILGQFSLLFGGETAAPLFFADSGQ
jgi:sugar lactone lactonase YvrE